MAARLISGPPGSASPEARSRIGALALIAAVLGGASSHSVDSTRALEDPFFRPLALYLNFSRYDIFSLCKPVRDVRYVM